MSTRPIERRRPRTLRAGRDVGRLLLIGVLFALAFAGAYLLGHAHAGADTDQHLPPSLPGLSTPLPTTLAAAPPIEVGVAKAPAAPPVTHVGSGASSIIAPTITTPATSAPTATAPSSPTLTAPSSSPESGSTSSPAPPPAGAGSGSNGSPRAGGGSGSGIPFESSD